LKFTYEYTLEKLKIDHITERFSRNDYKYVIGNVSLKSLLANKGLLEQKDVFIAHTGRYTYAEQQIQTVAEEEVLFN
jgi:homoserine dehydrogenase